MLRTIFSKSAWLDGFKKAPIDYVIASVLAFVAAKIGIPSLDALPWQLTGLGYVLIFVFLAYLVGGFRWLWFNRANAPPNPQATLDPQANSGKWVGSKYFYDEPALAFSTLAQQIDNNRDFHFQFLEAPAKALVGYKIVLEGPQDFISVVVKARPNGWPSFSGCKDHVYSKGSIRVNENRDLWLHYFIRSDADPFQIRIYVTDWDICDGKIISTHDKILPSTIDGGTF
ncbi:MAG: hypothetical protein K2X41_07340 [Hyphomicrobium sp.]|nr:hypothetical protein [Hyphomicrobium sp.]